MKKLLIGLLALGSISTFAQNNFVLTEEEPSVLVKEELERSKDLCTTENSNADCSSILFLNGGFTAGAGSLKNSARETGGFGTTLMFSAGVSLKKVVGAGLEVGLLNQFIIFPVASRYGGYAEITTPWVYIKGRYFKMRAQDSPELDNPFTGIEVGVSSKNKMLKYGAFHETNGNVQFSGLNLKLDLGSIGIFKKRRR